MVDAMQIGCDHEGAAKSLDPHRQAGIRVRRQGQKSHYDFEQEDRRRRCGGKGDGRHSQRHADHFFQRMEAEPRCDIDVLICVMQQVDAPHPAVRVHQPVSPVARHI